MEGRGLVILSLNSEAQYSHDDGRFVTQVKGFVPGSRVDLPAGYTHFGLVVERGIDLHHSKRFRSLRYGDFFSVVGPASLRSHGLGMVVSAKGYEGFNLFGGPLEKTGKLRYINGSTDTLLVPPVRRGDPCFNHLHFPPFSTQTPHTHPSVRVNVVVRGRGVCVVPDGSLMRRVELLPGHIFVIENDTVHSFDTEDSSMDVVTFHPDSDTGMTDDDHPMVNRTIVEGQSASGISEIRTR